MDFTLKVDEKMLQREAENLARQNTSAVQDAPNDMELRLPEDIMKKKAEKRKASSALPSRPALQVSGIEVTSQS